MKKTKLVITVPVTGAAGDRSTGGIPVTPKEIATSALEAYEAGASVAHIHVRDVKTGKPSWEFKLYEEVVQRIRDNSDMILNVTTGPGGRFIPDDKDPVGFAPGSLLFSPEKRIEHILVLKPEICSLDIGSMNFRPHVFVNYPPHVEWMAERIRDAGVKPELEVFELGHIEMAKHLLKTGIVKHPPLIQICLGAGFAMAATPYNMMIMKCALPPGAIWSAFGIGKSSFQMIAQATLLGGNIRIGMEDNWYLEKGKRASSNKELVEKAVKIIRLLGREPATPSEARRLFHLQ